MAANPKLAVKEMAKTTFKIVEANPLSSTIVDKLTKTLEAISDRLEDVLDEESLTVQDCQAAVNTVEKIMILHAVMGIK